MYSKILDISKRRGIVYPSYEIYGGVSGFYDYGPIGKLIKNNIENLIRNHYLIDENCFEIECPTLSPKDIWVASGHIENFTDLITECTKCGEPYRADHLIEADLKICCDGFNLTQIQELLDENDIRCPKCRGNLDKIYDYNLMFKTFVGPGKYKLESYLRAETAQGTFISFRRLWEIGRRKLPLGVFQIGHSFRNEISPRQGMIRLREFNQCEVQFFVEPGKKETEKFNKNKISEINVKIITKDDEEVVMTLGEAHTGGIIKIQMIAYFLGISLQLFEKIGINPKKLRLRQHKDDERAFYSSDTWDIECISEAFGRIELVGISDRTDYDLTSHQKLSKQDMTVNIEGNKFIPHVIEIAYGIDRPFYCVLESSIAEDERGIYFSFPEDVAPYKVSVFPLVRKDGIPEKAQEFYELLKNNKIHGFYDAAGSIGRRYARADEIGIPYCVTIDHQTLEDGTVTLRKRDTKEQERYKFDDLIGILNV